VASATAAVIGIAAVIETGVVPIAAVRIVADLATAAQAVHAIVAATIAAVAVAIPRLLPRKARAAIPQHRKPVIA